MNRYEPDNKKTKEEFLAEVEKVFTVKNYSKTIQPMTLEASVVRLSDIIAYIGRDIEDAIIVGSIKREEIPQKIAKNIGNTNAQIVNNLILDVIQNSIDQPYLKFSDDVFESLIALKAWNYEHIYYSKEAKKNYEILEKAFHDLYYTYLEKVEKRKKDKTNENLSYSEKNLYEFTEHKTEEYLSKTNLKRMILDYLSGQTDKFFLKECESNLNGLKIE